MQSRRDFLKLAAAMSGAAGLSGLVPESIRRAFAIEPTPGSTYADAEHIVILMQENRSFDHAFGALRGVRGFNDPRALRLANGNSVFVQTDAQGHSYGPWRLDIRDTRSTWMGDLPHSRHSQVDAWNHGRHDQWLEAKRSENKEYAHLPLTMGHYTREDLPFYYALADAFTICDQHYCSVMTSTSPNRCVLWTGTIRDRQSVNARVFMRNGQIDGGGMTWKTFPERLQDAGVSWKCYQNELSRSALTGEADAWLANFGDNVLEYFSAYNVEAALGSSGQARYQQLSTRDQALHDAAFVTNSGDPHYHALQSLTFEDQGQPQTMQAPRGDVLYQFRKDVSEGKLPTVSWLTAPERFSDHPTSPWYGAWYLSEVMDILTNNPEVWKKTIFLLTYDENDGLFDHAPSFAAADPKRPETGGASPGIDTGLEYTYREDELRQGVAAEEARSGPIGLGFRVPLLVASPWSRGGWVNSQILDHTSTLRFLENFVARKYGKPVREENISAWRRAVSGDLTSVFRPYEPKTATLDFVQRDQFVVGIEKARSKELPSNFTRLTSEQIEQVNRDPLHAERTFGQESGVRPSCALPYELYADGRLSDDGKHYELRFSAADQVFGSSAAGAPFNVYLRNPKEESSAAAMVVANYAVQPGDTLVKQYPLPVLADPRSSIEIHGPNGFYRSFTGAFPLEVRTVYESSGKDLTGNVQVHLRNQSHQKITITVTDNAYHARELIRTIEPGKDSPLVLDLQGSRGWYDFSLRAAGWNAETRYAGRVETGKPGISDPRMGGEA